jgi:hypothetical protein
MSGRERPAAKSCLEKSFVLVEIIVKYTVKMIVKVVCIKMNNSIVIDGF